jgi:hypothetical protein
VFGGENHRSPNTLPLYLAAALLFSRALFFAMKPSISSRGGVLVLSLAAVCARATAQTGVVPLRLALVEGLSGGFVNAGEAVFRNLLWAVERVKQRGELALPSGKRRLELLQFDSKGSTDEVLSVLRAALDQGVARPGAQLLGHGGGVDRCAGQTQRASSRAACVVAQPLGRRFGFRTVRRFEAAEVETPHGCKMPRIE